MKLKLSFLAALASAAIASQAYATTVLSDNFSSENGGVTAENYTGFANFSVFYGSVDLVHTGDQFGLNCGASSACVDLDGTTDTGGTLLSKAFNFNAGDLVDLTVSVSGNQRSSTAAADDTLALGFFTMGPSEITSIGVSGFPDNPGAGGSFPVDPAAGSFGYDSGPDTIPYNQGFQDYSIYFTAAQSGSFQAVIYTDSADDIGPLLNNVEISVSAAPEPSVWMLMIAGVAMIGGALRLGRKRRVGSLSVA